jgi:DNA-binding NtrC family response regulator
MKRDAQHRTRLYSGLREVEAALRSCQKEGAPLAPPERKRLDRMLQALQERLDGDPRAAETAAAPVSRQKRLVGESASIQAVRSTIDRIAPRDSNVLIQGESGTGKELVARAIHMAGPRGRARFVPVDCGALADSLLESELFGHRKGSFTGAVVDRAGLLEEADGGTLFLDELANASPAFQTRLLRVLQEREIRRVGENRVRRVSLRVITATSGDLPRLMAGGTFRQDLYYRLNVVSLEVAPLRERPEDIPLLLEHALRSSVARHGLPPKGLSQAALEVLLRYRWPGNVRELENVVERAVLMAPGDVITPENLPAALLDALLHLGCDRNDGASRKTGEQQLVERALLEADGNRTRAAHLIGWSRGKLYRRLIQFRIPWEFGRPLD